MLYRTFAAIVAIATLTGIVGADAATASSSRRPEACVAKTQPVGNKNSVEVCRREPKTGAFSMGQPNRRRLDSQRIGNKLTVELWNQ